jgi:hypothetical protein
MTYERTEAKVMEQIRELMAIADRCPEGDPEREVALRRANSLMTKNAIDQAKLDATRTLGEKRVPTQMTFRFISGSDLAWEWLYDFRQLMREVCAANRVRCVFLRGEKGAAYDVALVGMQEDVEWTQLLWMRVFLDFVSKLSPKWVPGPQRTVGHNVAAFKGAGFKWKEIWEIGKRAEPTIDTFDRYDPKDCNYLMREYKRHLKMTGEQPVGTQKFEGYRYSFVQSFIATVSARLEEMREQAKQDVETSGSAVALVDVGDRVDEEFYRLFPSQRPLSEEELRAARERMDAEARAKEEADQAFLSSLSDRERKRVLEERAKERERAARNSEKYWRDEAKRQERLHDGAGYVAGRTAGKSVRLDRSVEVGTETRKEVSG